jgi:hypothetical protein
MQAQEITALWSPALPCAHQEVDGALAGCLFGPLLSRPGPPGLSFRTFLVRKRLWGTLRYKYMYILPFYTCTSTPNGELLWKS